MSSEKSIRTPEVQLVLETSELVTTAGTGRTAVLGIELTRGAAFGTPGAFVDALGSRLALWVDHRESVAWGAYAFDPRFVLVGEPRARSSAQLVTPEVAARAGEVEVIVAGARLDGVLAAAKLLRGGEPAYVQADEDAQADETPGRGFSWRGRRLALALAELQLRGPSQLPLAVELVRALAKGETSTELDERLELLAAARAARERRLRHELARLEFPHPLVGLLRLSGRLSAADRRFVVHRAAESAAVALVHADGWTTAATLDDEGRWGFDLRRLPGLDGRRGQASGQVEPEVVLPAVIRAVESRERELTRPSATASSCPS